LVHLGLVVTCVAYIVLGAYLFQTIERPIELQKRAEALNVFDRLQNVGRSPANPLFQEFMSNVSERGDDVERMVDSYIESILLLFENPHYAHVFETHFTNQSLDKDIWTFPAAVLFTTTTVIPVGYGNVCPSSELGKLLLIIYGIIGIPLALVTMADTGKFLNRRVFFRARGYVTVLATLPTNCFQSMAWPTGLFLSLLCFYPVIGGLLFHHFADLEFRDAIYFSFTSIFTIGFGDLMPSINVIYLVFFLIFGVILVTITIDFVAAEVIDRIHYMGRHVGKAREIAGKMMQVQSIESAQLIG
uniref:Ion channel n=1 Tax=Heligmosomoides polygyrus TaxID=6339 RepID=A0A183G5J7_HELPZ